MKKHEKTRKSSYLTCAHNVLTMCNQATGWLEVVEIRNKTSKGTVSYWTKHGSVYVHDQRGTLLTMERAPW